MTVKDAYAYSVIFLERNGIDEPDFKALCLACHLSNIKNNQYEQHKDDFVPQKKLADALWRLKNNEPLQYVIGKWDFYESEFYVGEGVLIPRPETEELVEKVIDCAKNIPDCVVYDLCSGTGCIGISVAKKCGNTFVYLIEKSDDAMPYLEKNASGIDNVKIIQADICDDIDNFSSLENADIIVSNPPYIASSEIDTLQSEVQKEPRMALDGGEDGLDFYRVISDNWYAKLKRGGKIFLEIGEKQANLLLPIMKKFDNILVIKDMYGNDRIVTAVKP